MNKYIFNKTWFVCFAIYLVFFILSFILIASPLNYVFSFPFCIAIESFNLEVRSNILAKTVFFLNLAINCFLITTLLNFFYLKLKN